MNERLTFTVGSALDFGLTTQQATYAAVQFLPNVTAEWKLTENGRVVLTFFYRDSYNYLSLGNHTMNSSGTSISYRRDFDNLDEIFKKKKKTEVLLTDNPLRSIRVRSIRVPKRRNSYTPILLYSSLLPVPAVHVPVYHVWYSGIVRYADWERI